MRFVCQNYKYEANNIQYLISNIQVGLSNLQFVDLNSTRNLFVLGFSIFFSLVSFFFLKAPNLVFFCATSELYYTSNKSLIFRCCPSG